MFAPPSERYDLPWSTEQINDPIQAGSAVLAAYLEQEVDDIDVTCDFTRIEDDVVASATITSKRKITCSRCLQEHIQEVKQQFSKHYAYRGREKNDGASDVEPQGNLGTSFCPFWATSEPLPKNSRKPKLWSLWLPMFVI